MHLGRCESLLCRIWRVVKTGLNHLSATFRGLSGTVNCTCVRYVICKKYRSDHVNEAGKEKG